jgi:hypothetical protein
MLVSPFQITSDDFVRRWLHVHIMWFAIKPIAHAVGPDEIALAAFLGDKLEAGGERSVAEHCDKPERISIHWHFLKSTKTDRSPRKAPVFV